MPLIGELCSLANELGSCPAPCCTPCTPTDNYCYPPANFPFAQVTMTCPPPCLAPTAPQPVKPLQLPCPKYEAPKMSPQERFESRYDNFYNNYNIDWHPESPIERCQEFHPFPCTEAKQCGVTVDGKNPCCGECRKPRPCCKDKGCPTGFKPCTMKLTPPCGCDPRGVWIAEVQPCPPKSKAKQKKKNCCPN